MSERDWPVLPHGPLERVADNLWQVHGKVPSFPLQRVMAVARLRDGRLVVHGAMALDDAGMKAIEALGEPAVLLVPSGYHRIDAPRYARRYPAMRVLCPAGAKGRVESVVRVDGTYDAFVGDGDGHGHATVTLEHIDGIADREGVVRIASSDGTTLVFNDILFNMPHAPGLGGLFTRAIGSSGGPRVSRTARVALMKDARALARRFVALASTPDLVRVMVAHHETIAGRKGEPGDALRSVAMTL
jgi:hypothetical protein